MNIAVYAIAKDEINNTEQWMRCVRFADHVVVADTGSTDGTAEALRSLGAAVHDISLRPWRFDHARNSVLDLLPADIDVCISLDLDERLLDGWRHGVESAWLPDTTKLMCTYIDGFDQENNVPNISTVFKIHSRYGYRWARQIREHLVPNHDEQMCTARSVVIYHQRNPDRTADHSHMLASAHREDPSDLGMLFALCEHLVSEVKTLAVDNKERITAVHHVRKFLDLADGTWADERSQAQIWLSKILAHERVNRLRMGIAESPSRREPWLELCNHYAESEDWINLFAASTDGSTIAKRTYSKLEDNAAWGPALREHNMLAMRKLGLR